jgi:hypothetical protein
MSAVSRHFPARLQGWAAGCAYLIVQYAAAKGHKPQAVLRIASRRGTASPVSSTEHGRRQRIPQWIARVRSTPRPDEHDIRKLSGHRRRAKPGAAVIACLLALLIGMGIMYAYASRLHASRQDGRAAATVPVGEDMALCEFNRRFAFRGPPVSRRNVGRPPPLGIVTCNTR